MTWEEAKTFCEQQGGHLVTISSEDEQSFDKLQKRRDDQYYEVKPQGLAS